MRITNNMMVDTFMVNMQNNLSKMDKYTNQLASNRRMVRLSDDPVGVYSALTARERLARCEQYQRNLVYARNWVEQCDASLQELSGKVTDFRDQVINAATNAKTNEDRENIAVLAKELKKSIMEAMNGSVGNQYLFAGFNTTNQPFTIDSASGKVFYNGLDMTNLDTANLTKLQDEMGQQLTIEVGYALHMNITMPGLEVVGVGSNDNLFAILDDVIKLMDDPTLTPQTAVAQLSGMLGRIDTAHNNVTKSLAQAGGMYNRVEMLEDRYSQDVINYNDMRSRIEDIDSAETIMDWKMAEAVYQQSLATGARVILPTLMDFLH